VLGKSRKHTITANNLLHVVVSDVGHSSHGNEVTHSTKPHGPAGQVFNVHTSGIQLSQAHLRDALSTT
jgi:hypothetical protein